MADEAQPEAPAKVTLNDALEISRDLMAASARIMSTQPNMAIDVYMFAIHRALAGMAVVGYGMVYNRLPSDEDIDKLAVLYKAHLRDARKTEQASPGPVN